MRLWNTTPRIFKGRNSNGMEFPLGWGSSAAPAAGSCAGVKNDTPAAGTLAGDMFRRIFQGNDRRSPAYLCRANSQSTTTAFSKTDCQYCYVMLSPFGQSWPARCMKLMIRSHEFWLTDYTMRAYRYISYPNIDVLHL